MREMEAARGEFASNRFLERWIKGCQSQFGLFFLLFQSNPTKSLPQQGGFYIRKVCATTNKTKQELNLARVRVRVRVRVKVRARERVLVAVVEEEIVGKFGPFVFIIGDAVCYVSWSHDE